jgi:xanthine dehydrogenase YagT iron-sulfur-binding subunit
MNITFTRRDRIAGTAAGVGTVSSIGGSAGAAEVSSTSSPEVPIHTMLRINGREHRVSHDIRASLLDTLREHIGLTGTKQGCDHGQCGECTVRIDGKPGLACLTLTVAAEGADIVTTEGLAPLPIQLNSMHA